jgi:selenide, water dikinase
MKLIPVGPSDPALLVGLDAPDDAGIYQVSSDVALVQTVDFFTPIVDDAATWGAIAATNALSDVYAMGGTPRTALNIVAWPRDLDFSILGAVLRGGQETCERAGVSIVGGHSIDDPEPKYGLAVTGVIHPNEVITKTGASPGAVLLLTKAIGTGIISSAIKRSLAEDESVAAAIRTMTTLNRAACEAMRDIGVQAATDVTGFSLIGHLLQMLGEDLDAHLDAEAIPLLPGAVELARRGVIPGGSARNRKSQSPRVTADGVDEALLSVLFDAQTSGGLLIAVAPDKAPDLIDRIAGYTSDVAQIGTLIAGDGRVRVFGRSSR